MEFNKIIHIRGVGCCGNSEEEEGLWLGRGEICSKDHPDTGGALVRMREGTTPNRINRADREAWVVRMRWKRDTWGP